MRASTLLLATFIIWIAAKGRLGQYWALATTNASAVSTETSASGPGGGLLHASSLPGFSIGNPLPVMEIT